MSNVTTEYANDAFTKIVNPNLSGAEVIINTEDDSQFPVLGNGVYAFATLENTAGQVEVVKITTHMFGSNQFTVERGQDNTAAAAWIAGDYIEMRPCSAVFEELRDHNHDTELAPINHDHDSVYIPFSGGQLTGQLKGVDPAAVDDLTRKDYVDAVSLTKPFANDRSIRDESEIPESDPGGGPQGNADLLVVSGFYKTDAQTQNLPTDSDKIGFVSHFADKINSQHYQIFHELSTNVIYRRTYHTGVWQAWETSIVASDYATDTTGGTLKMLVDGTDLYITNDGSDAVAAP